MPIDGGHWSKTLPDCRFLLGLATALACAGCVRPAVVEDFVDPAAEAPVEDTAGLPDGVLPSPPAFPNEALLQPVDLGPVSNFSFFVDPASVDVRPGQIVRFTLVAKSPGGATNVSFEALRCTTRERRLYAFGSASGQWAKPTVSQWQPLDRGTASRPYAALATLFFCPNGLGVQSTPEALQALRRGAHPATDIAPVR